MKKMRNFPKVVVNLTLLVTMITSATFLIPPIHATSSASLTSIVPARTVWGDGDFPRFPVVAPSADGKTMALYLVEGDKATQLLTFEGSTVNDKFDCQLSNDEQYYACLISPNQGSAAYIEVVNMVKGTSTLLDKGKGALSNEKGAATEQITSLAWMDNQHVMYAKVTWPSALEQSTLKKGSPFPLKGEVWSSSVDGAEERLIATGAIYRVLGISPKGQTLYVTRLITGAEEWQMEGFAIFDMTSGKMENLWPQEQAAKPVLYDFQLITLPDGTPRILFFDGGQAPGGTVFVNPPVLWMGDPESRQSEAIWTIDHGESTGKGDPVYWIPNNILWSKREEKEFIYVLSGKVWHVDLSTSKEELLGTADPHLLAWTANGVVSQNQGDIHLFDTASKVQNEIRLSESRAQISPDQITNAVVNWRVPYIHQLYDTYDWFDGNNACGPTSAVMALAYYKRFAPHPISVSSPILHTSDYGWYITTQYSAQSACTGTSTFDRTQTDPRGNSAAGAYGYTTDNGSAYAYRIQDYALKHDTQSMFEYTSGSNAQSDLQGDLRGGAIVLLSTGLTSAGHIIVVRGYTQDGNYIVNDPFGKNLGGRDNYDHCNASNIHCGEQIEYTWNQMNPSWYVALYGPQYLPDLQRHGSWDGNIVIQNGTSWPGGADICLVNADGSQNGQSIGSQIAANGTTVYPLSSMTSYLAGAAVVRPKQTAQMAVVENLRSNGGIAYAATNYTGITPSGWGNPEWGQAATTIYVPIAKSNRYGYTTDLHIMNTGLEATIATANFYDNAGSLSSGWSCYLGPGAQCIGTPVTDGIFTAQITASQPVAAVVVERNADQSYTRVSTSNTIATGATTSYLPIVKKKRYGNSTGTRIQNIGSGTANVTITYYQSNSSNVYTSGPLSINRGGAVTVLDDAVLPDSFVGSARVVSNQPIVAQTNEEGTMQKMSSSAVLQGSTSVYLLRVCNACSIGGVAFLAGIRILNVGSTVTNVTIHYYSSTGQEISTETISNLGAYRAQNAASVPANFIGSARVTADQPIVAVVNLANSDVNQDLTMTYNAPNR